MTGLPDAAAGEHPALLAYQQRAGRDTRIYTAVLALLVLFAFIGVKLAYAHGELTKVSFRTAPAATPLRPGMPGTALRATWHTDDAAAGGSPYDNGVVVTFAGHSVNGRDAVSGNVRWHYTRSDENLCSVLQQDGTTIAIYRRKGNCDEVTGIVTATGQPKWYRTLTDDGETASASTSNVVMTVNAHIVHAFDNAGGLDRWDWTAPDNCTVQHALTGSLGVLIALTCGGGHQLALHDLITDTVKWTVNTSAAMLPIAADNFVGALDPATGTVNRYTPDKGAASKAAQLPPDSGAGGTAGSGSDGMAGVPNATITEVPSAAAGVTANDAAGQPVQLVQLSRLFVFSPDGSLRWSAASTGPAWPVESAYLASQDGPGQVVVRQTDTGKPELVCTLTPAASSATDRVYPVGTGLLLAGSGSAMYR